MDTPRDGAEERAQALRSARPPSIWRRRPRGLVRRFIEVQGHLLGLLLGAFLDWLRAQRQVPRPYRPVLLPLRLLGWLVRPLVAGEIARESFPRQLRRRLELLGPAYVKLGQIMSLRSDLLPAEITSELRMLLDRVPPVPFPMIRIIVEQDLRRPLDALFTTVDPEPLGSASIAQTHRAVTRDGKDVILKVVKPGIRQVLQRDARLLRLFGGLLQLLVPRFQPKRIVREYLRYILREVDMVREADNSETFALNFRDLPEVVFPHVERAYSGRDVLCMEYLHGVRPDAEAARALPLEQRERIIDVGAATIIRMLYQDGFFHADLHPGNILILEGGRLGFIDLGMVGRLDQELRRSLMYYYHSLVLEDYEHAARFLAAVAEPGPGANPTGFRREVAEISRRWRRASGGYSLAQLILESIQRGGRYRMYFPVEMVMMVKALVTYEGVGLLLAPGLNVAELTRRHVTTIFRQQLSPVRLVQEALREAPGVLEALLKVPALVTEGLRLLEQRTRAPVESPLAGLRASVFGGFCLLSGALLAAAEGPWPVWGLLILIGFIVALRRG